MVTTIFVSNIPYSATKEDLGQYFAKYGAVKDTRILTESFRGQLFSRGIGFVEFESENSAQSALNETAEHTIGDRHIRISAAKPRVERKRDTAFIGGIPVGTTENDLMDPFRQYNPAEVKIVRENQNNRRGFAFIRFATSEDQDGAVKSCRTVMIKGEESIVRYAHYDFGTQRPQNRRRIRRGGRRAFRPSQNQQGGENNQ